MRQYLPSNIILREAIARLQALSNRPEQAIVYTVNTAICEIRTVLERLEQKL